MFRYEVIQSLNNLELSLYEYIMKNSKKVIYMRIRELAEEAHVSTTTILRFCKKLNCEGFSEFKVKFNDKDRNKGVDILALCLIKELGRDKNIPEELVRAVEIKYDNE